MVSLRNVTTASKTTLKVNHTNYATVVTPTEIGPTGALPTNGKKLRGLVPRSFFPFVKIVYSHLQNNKMNKIKN